MTEKKEGDGIMTGKWRFVHAMILIVLAGQGIAQDDPSQTADGGLERVEFSGAGHATCATPSTDA